MKLIKLEDLNDYGATEKQLNYIEGLMSKQGMEWMYDEYLGTQPEFKLSVEQASKLIKALINNEVVKFIRPNDKIRPISKLEALNIKANKL